MIEMTFHNFGLFAGSDKDDIRHFTGSSGDFYDMQLAAMADEQHILKQYPYYVLADAMGMIVSVTDDYSRLTPDNLTMIGFDDAALFARISTAAEKIFEKQFRWDGTAIVEYYPPYIARREGEFREFMALFTPEEQMALKSAEQTDVKVALYFDLARGGATLSLDHPSLVEAMHYYVVQGLITAERAAHILAADFNVPS